jgi:hypothetical protein
VNGNKSPQLVKAEICRKHFILRDLDRQLQFNKRSQLLSNAHNKTLVVAAMRVSNPDRSPVRSNR